MSESTVLYDGKIRFQTCIVIPKRLFDKLREVDNLEDYGLTLFYNAKLGEFQLWVESYLKEDK